MTKTTPLPTFSGFVSMGNFMVDMHRQTGRKEYLEWVLDNLNAGLLKLRITDRKSEDYGAFKGEDEPSQVVLGRRAGRVHQHADQRLCRHAAVQTGRPEELVPGVLGVRVG